RRQLPGRLRPHAREGGPAHHPGGAGRPHPRAAAQPERALRGRRADRPGVDLLPDGQELHRAHRGAPALARPPQAPAVRHLHRGQHGLRAARLLHVRGRGGPDRHRADHVLLLLQREGADPRSGRDPGVHHVPERPLLPLHQRLLPPDDARHRPPPEGDLPGDDAAGLPVRPQQGASPLPQHDGVDAPGGGRPLGPLGRSRPAGARARVAPGAGSPPQVAHVARGGARPLRAPPRAELHEGGRGGGAGAGAAAARPARVPVQDRHGPAGPAPAQHHRHAGPADLRVRRGFAHRLVGAAEGAAQVPAGQGRPVPDLRHEPRARSAAGRRARAGAQRGSAGPSHQPLAPLGRRTGVMEKFRGVDYYGMDELLTEEQRMMRDAVRDWVEAKFLPIVNQHHRDGTFPTELARDLGEMGVFGATLKGYGCAGLDNVAYGLIMQELERGDSGLRSFASVQSGLVMYPIYAYGSDAQKDRWLPRLQSGAALGCFGLTEPDHGSDPGSMKTRAVKKGQEYVLNGTKLWITNGSVADVAVVWAKGDDGEIGGYLVEKGTPGYSTLDIHGKFSMRASITSELAFADCKIPLE